MDWVQVLGWIAAVALVLSRWQVDVLRNRLLYIAACTGLLVFTLVLGIWPLVAANLVLTARAVHRARELLRLRDPDRYDVLEVGPQDEYLRHLLRVHGADILERHPGFVWDGAATGQHAALIQLEAETVGVVLFHSSGDGSAHVDLDYATRWHRHLRPGMMLAARGFFSERGFHSARTSPHGPAVAVADPDDLGDLWRLGDTRQRHTA